ncbi:MAG: type II toxin-antitoxin system VapC family toxin [Planctomycetota bacterium]
MKPAIYLETTIVSYLAAWPSRDLLIAAHQSLTREWWETRRHEYNLCISQAVIEEASVGDVAASARRRALLEGLRNLALNDAARALAHRIVREASLPPRAGVDALHVAVAAVHGVQTLLTWNCRHIASVTFRPRIESVCRAAGVVPPVICTPLELMER